MCVLPLRHTFLSITRHSSSDTKAFWLPKELATLLSLLVCCSDVLGSGSDVTAGGCSAQ